MSTLSFLRALGVSSLLVAALSAQVVLDHSITLDDGDPTSPDTGFGIVMAPDGINAYAPLAGDLFGINNDDVARLDVIAGTQLGTAHTQLYPEDPALTHDATGAARHLYVTNSTSGSVTCLTPALAFVATIPLPSCSGFSSYPFGLLVSPDQTRIYVSTLGGCGDVYVIDSDPASAAFNTVVKSFTVPNSGARMSWWTYPLLVVSTTTYDAPFPATTLSQGGFTVVDVQNTVNQTPFVVTQPIPNHFAFATECVVIPGGLGLLTVGNEVFPTVYECDLATGAITRTLNLNTIAGIILHGLVVSPDKTLGVVTSLNGGETVFFDLASFTVVGVYSHGSSAKPNDVVFTPDGSRAVVSLQGAARVDVLKGIPGYALTLVAHPSVAVGANLTYSVAHCEAGQPWAMYYSLSGSGPQQIGPYTIFLSNPFDLAWQGVGGVQGTDFVTFVVPNLPGLPGTTISTQAVTVDRDGTFRLSNGVQTLVL